MDEKQRKKKWDEIEKSVIKAVKVAVRDAREAEDVPADMHRFVVNMLSNHRNVPCLAIYYVKPKEGVKTVDVKVWANTSPFQISAQAMTQTLVGIQQRLLPQIQKEMQGKKIEIVGANTLSKIRGQ